MACLIAPAAEAAVVTIVCRRIEKKEALNSKSGQESGCTKTNVFLEKRKWLTNLLWSGSLLLLLEHMWHGEIVPYFPFLTAMYNPADTAAMIQEILTTGVLMCVFVTLVWVGMVGVYSLSKKQKNAETAG